MVARVVRVLYCSQYCFTEDMSRKERQKGKLVSITIMYLSECCFGVFALMPNGIFDSSELWPKISSLWVCYQSQYCIDA